jgi:hypothetical protein
LPFADRDGLKDLNAGSDDLLADAVTRDCCDAVSLHSLLPVLVYRLFIRQAEFPLDRHAKRRHAGHTMPVSTQ